VDKKTREVPKKSMETEETDMYILMIIVLIITLFMIGILVYLLYQDRETVRIRKYYRARRTINELGELIELLPPDERYILKHDAKLDRENKK
jgi:heme/copper-type cytochrome/quinol oxidase subunit 2